MRHVATFATELLGPEGAAQFAWSPQGDLLAAAGARRKKVVLFDRSGEVAASFTVPDPEFLYDEEAETPVAALSWHPSGSHLAVLPRGHAFAMVWSAATREMARVDGGVKPAEVSALAWCPDRAALVLGTVKGTGILYDCASRTTTPLALGRSSVGKPVACAAWSAGAVPGGLLALGCKGGLLLLCRACDGGLERSVQLKGAVSQLQFCETGAGGEGSSQAPPTGAGGGACGALLAANVGRRAVCIWQFPQALGPSATSVGPFELAFREGYGELESFCWAHPRLLAAGFSSGQLVAVSLSGGLAPGAGAGTELFSARCLQGAAGALSWCREAGALAAGGGCQLAVLSCRGQEVALQTAGVHSLELEGGQRLAGLEYSPGGKLLTLLTTGGRLLHLLAAPPVLHGTWHGSVAYVDPNTAPGEVLLVAEPGASPVALPLPPEAEQLALGPGYLAAAQGSRVWYQGVEAEPSTGLLPAPVEAEFPTPITWLRLNASCVLLLGEGGRVFVQPAPGAAGSYGGGGGGEVVELRGEDGEPFAAACAALADDYILLGLPDGTLGFYECGGGCALLTQFVHERGGIAAVHPSADGKLVLFQDTAGSVLIYDAVQGELMAPPGFEGSLAAAVWDSADAGVVAAVNSGGSVHVYCHVPASVQGPGLKLVGTQAGPPGAAPLTLRSGVLTWHLPDGALHHQLLATHTHLAEPPARGRSNSGKGQLAAAWGGAESAAAGAGMSREERLAARCQQALALGHFPRALEAARMLGDPQLLREVALAALQFLEFETALAAYQAAGDDEAVAQLQPLEGMRHDENLLTGHLVAIVGGDADRAEQLLLASSQPTAAIEMRKQQGQWERALALAEQLEPGAVGGMAALRATALEAEGQVEAATALYQQALAAPDLAASGGAISADVLQRRADCTAGLARCSILLGDAERGMELAAASGSAPLLLQCAALLEGQQAGKAAGQLYALAGQHDKAAQLFLRAREFALLDGVMAHAGSPALWLQYAQAKEDLGSFGDAARAYEQAGDVMAAVRVLLQRLGDAEAAADLAACAGSADASLAVARFCELAGKHQLAVEQYCFGGDCTAAFVLAQRAACVPVLAAWARRAGSAEAAQLVAGHYEAAGELAAAGELCALAGQTERAVRLYVQAGGDSVPAAIKLAGEAKDPAVAAVVLDHLQAVDSMGPALLDLHLALGNAEQACAVAEARAQQEQAAGNYKVARDQLLAICRELQGRGAPATPSLLSALHLLHSYLLVRTLVRQGDHLAAARLLLVVADSIDAFPRHAVAILTSTVIECHRAALHGAAQRWAAALQQPPYAGQVASAYAKKIEAIARQPAWTESGKGEEEPCCECLFCGAPGPESSLRCASCRKALPFCCASGKRMALNDWSECPGGQERACPLCEAAVGPHDIKKVFDPISALRRTVFADLLRGSNKERSGR
ncbi:hypothetical protein ABPG75_000713 [Micractinium tetrahymenae]